MIVASTCSGLRQVPYWKLDSKVAALYGQNDSKIVSAFSELHRPPLGDGPGQSGPHLGEGRAWSAGVRHLQVSQPRVVTNQWNQGDCVINQVDLRALL